MRKEQSSEGMWRARVLDWKRL